MKENDQKAVSVKFDAFSCRKVDDTLTDVAAVIRNSFQITDQEK